MSFEQNLTSINNGLSTTLQGYKTAKAGLSDGTNLALILGGALLAFLLLKRGEK